MAIFAVIFPVFAIALVGYIMAWRRHLSAGDISGISKFVFSVAIPVLLFNSLAHQQLPQGINWAFLLSYFGVALLTFGLGMALSKVRFGHLPREQSVFGLGSSYSNTVLVGLPIISTGLGEAALVPMFMLISLHSAILFFVVTLFAERDRSDGRSPWSIAGQTARSLVRNPIIIGLTAGLFVNFLSIPIPGPLATSLEILGQAALPSALFVLGASLSAYKITGHMQEAWTIVLLKLIVQPLLVWILVFLVFRIDPLWGAVAVMAAGLPVGVNAYMFAQKYQVAIASLSSAVLLSSLLSIASQSIFLALFI